LCFAKNDLPAQWTKQKVSIKLNEQEFKEVLDNTDFTFKNRDFAEQDFDFKQVIPYIIIQNPQKNLTAVYKRKGSEKRLNDLWSAGIGGHVNISDNNEESVYKTIKNGMLRELSEEITDMPENTSINFCGIINEEETEVGKVHIGAVYKIISDNSDLFIPGEELDSFKFIRNDNLTDLNMELWSRLALELQ